MPPGFFLQKVGELLASRFVLPLELLLDRIQTTFELAGNRGSRTRDIVLMRSDTD